MITNIEKPQRSWYSKGADPIAAQVSLGNERKASNQEMSVGTTDSEREFFRACSSIRKSILEVISSFDSKSAIFGKMLV
jgi:hypothetical protein